MCQTFMFALSLSHQSAESLFAALPQIFLFILGIDRNHIVFSSVAKSFASLPSSPPPTPPPSPGSFLKVPRYFCLKCGQSAEAAAPACHFYSLVYLLR